MQEFQAWRTETIHLSRAPEVKPCSVPSFQKNDCSRVAEYLGFCHTYELGPVWGPGVWPINLSLYLQPTMYMRYVGFLQVRGVTGDHVRKATICAANVVAFLLSTTAGITEEEEACLTSWRGALLV